MKLPRQNVYTIILLVDKEITSDYIQLHTIFKTNSNRHDNVLGKTTKKKIFATPIDSEIQN